MTEEEKLALCAVVHKLNAISCAIDALTAYMIAKECDGARAMEFYSIAVENTDWRMESSRKCRECTDAVSEMWGGECSE